jgi:hypothetical protein
VKGGVEVLMVSNKHNDGLIFPKGTFPFISVWAISALTLFTIAINRGLGDGRDRRGSRRA